MGVHRKSEKLVVSLLVMRIVSDFLGASITCAYFRDSITEFRLSKAKRDSYANHIAQTSRCRPIFDSAGYLAARLIALLHSWVDKSSFPE